MATCRFIVNGALRKIGRLGAGREPRPADQADTFSALQNLYRQLINQGTFGRLSDVIPVGDSYNAGENERIFRQQSATLTVNLPETLPMYNEPRPYNQERAQYGNVIGNTRPPKDCAVVVVDDAFTGITTEFIYDGAVRKWMSIYDLTLDDEAPLSRRDEQGLMAYLAAQIVDEFAAEMGKFTLTQAAGFLSSLSTRFSTPDRVSPGVFV